MKNDGLDGLRDAFAVMDEWTITDGWIRRQYDGVIEIGPYRSWRDHPKRKVPTIVMFAYLVVQLITRERVSVWRFNEGRWNLPQSWADWLLTQSRARRRQRWLRVTL